MLTALGIHDLPLFLLSGLLLNLTPGPDMLFVAGSTAASGRRAGLYAALGIGAGCLLHVGFAAVGLSALLAASPWAFRGVQWVGAAYLVWMGIGMWRATFARPGAGAAGTSAADGAAVAESAATPDARRLFLRGLLTNALNPKVALFFLAFLPQFIQPALWPQAWAFLALGLVFTLNGVLVTLAIAWMAGAARERMAGRGGRAASGARWLQRGAGALFIGLGLKIAAGAR